jgi:hypothetical protein
LHEFKFDELLVNKELIEVFVQHIKQEVYSPALNQLNKKSPIEGLDLKNHETYSSFKKMLESVMTVVRNIQDPNYGVKPQMLLLVFIRRFNIHSECMEILSRTSAADNLCLCHVQHLYEIIELT